MKHLLFALAWFVVALVAAPRVALAYTPPPMTAHVTDTAGKLTETQRLAIDKKLEDYRLRTSNEIAVFLPKSLEGESIEDVANATARAWHLGAKGKDNGVLLVIAPAERRARIETALGTQGSLTDLQTNDIIRTKIKPRLTPGREDYAAAVDGATDGIMDALGGAGGSVGPKAPRAPVTAGSAIVAIVMLLIFFGLPILVFVLVITRIARAFSSGGSSTSPGWTTGSSWSSSNDSSWSSSSSDSSWSSGGDSGFSGGGGGGFDGGGSSDSF